MEGLSRNQTWKDLLWCLHYTIQTPGILMKIKLFTIHVMFALCPSEGRSRMLCIYTQTYEIVSVYRLFHLLLSPEHYLI